MALGERGESKRDEAELAERRGDADAHQREVAAPCAPERRARLHERERKRERQGEMAGFDDHGLTFPVSPSCQRPCFFSSSTTSRGI